MAAPLDLPPPPDGTPAGPNMEADAEDQSFGEVERAAKGKPESQFGSTIEAAQPPDWPAVVTGAEALLTRSRDLRIMVLLGMARVNLHDMPGFATVLATIREHIDGLWDHVHPELDPEDDNDPTLRSNSLVLLTEPARMLRPLRDLPLAQMQRVRAGTSASSTTMRPISWRDIAIANGNMEAEPGREKLAAAEIRAIFAGTDPIRLAALRQGLADSIAELQAIPVQFQAKAGAIGPDFKDLLKLVRDLQTETEKYAQAGDEDEAPAPEPDAPGDDPAAAAPARTARSAPTIRAIPPLTSRDDALTALDLAADYFRTHEPSSPVPLLINRARRLAPLPFLEILRDLAPDGLQQAQTVAGTTGE